MGTETITPAVETGSIRTTDFGSTQVKGGELRFWREEGPDGQLVLRAEYQSFELEYERPNVLLEGVPEESRAVTLLCGEQLQDVEDRLDNAFAAIEVGEMEGEFRGFTVGGFRHAAEVITENGDKALIAYWAKPPVSPQDEEAYRRWTGKEVKSARALQQVLALKDENVRTQVVGESSFEDLKFTTWTTDYAEQSVGEELGISATEADSFGYLADFGIWIEMVEWQANGDEVSLEGVAEAAVDYIRSGLTQDDSGQWVSTLNSQDVFYQMMADLGVGREQIVLDATPSGELRELTAAREVQALGLYVQGLFGEVMRGNDFEIERALTDSLYEVGLLKTGDVSAFFDTVGKFSVQLKGLSVQQREQMAGWLDKAKKSGDGYAYLIQEVMARLNPIWKDAGLQPREGADVYWEVASLAREGMEGMIRQADQGEEPELPEFMNRWWFNPDKPQGKGRLYRQNENGEWEKVDLKQLVERNDHQEKVEAVTAMLMGVAAGMRDKLPPAGIQRVVGTGGALNKNSATDQYQEAWYWASRFSLPKEVMYSLLLLKNGAAWGAAVMAEKKGVNVVDALVTRQEDLGYGYDLYYEPWKALKAQVEQE